MRLRPARASLAGRAPGRAALATTAWATTALATSARATTALATTAHGTASRAVAALGATGVPSATPRVVTRLDIPVNVLRVGDPSSTAGWLGAPRIGRLRAPGSAAPWTGAALTRPAPAGSGRARRRPGLTGDVAADLPAPAERLIQGVGEKSRLGGDHLGVSREAEGQHNRLALELANRRALRERGDLFALSAHRDHDLGPHLADRRSRQLPGRRGLHATLLGGVGHDPDRLRLLRPPAGR
jgi:hypothetical protein